MCAFMVVRLLYQYLMWRLDRAMFTTTQTWRLSLPGRRHAGAGSRPDGFPHRDGALVNRFPRAADGLERQFLVRHFDEHERSIGVEGGGRHGGRSDIACAHLSPAARHEVMDPLLRFDSLVEVLVAAEHRVDAVFHDKRLRHTAQPRMGCP